MPPVPAQRGPKTGKITKRTHFPPWPPGALISLELACHWP